MRIALLVVLALSVAPRVADAGNGKSLLPLVAEDASTVVVVDVADARDAAVFARLWQLALDRGWQGAAQLGQVGIDPVADIDTILVATAAKRVVILEGRFDKLAVDSAAFTTAKHRGVAYWSDGTLDIGMVGKRLVIADAGGIEGVIDRARKKSKKTLTRSSKAAAIRASIALTDTRHDVWMAFASSAALGFEAEATSLGLSLGDDIVIEGRIQSTDADAAAAWASIATSGLDQLRQGLDQFGLSGLAASMALSVDDDVVRFDAALPGAELDTLVTLASSFL